MRKENHSLKVLAVEDNPGDYVLIEDYISELVLSPIIENSRSFGETREILANNGHFDAILLDLSLPDRSREELIRDMLVLAKTIPIIVLTGYSDEAFARKSLSLGISDYLLKDELTPAILYKSIIYNIERSNFLHELKLSEQRYSDLFHLSPQPSWVYDLETLGFLDINQAAIEHYGYSREEFLRMTIRDIRPASELPKLEAALKVKLKKPGRYFHGEFCHRKKNGELIQVELHTTLINFNGKTAKLAISNDVTERANHVQAIENQNTRLKEIAWIQSHVVRAPLARLMGLVSLLKMDEGPAAEDAVFMLDNVMISAQELDDIINKIVQKTQQVFPE